MPTQGNTTATHSENMAEEGDNSPPIVSEPQPASIPLHWQMLSAAVLAQITVSVVTQGVPTLAPFIQADLGLSHGQVGLCNSAIMTGSLCSMFLAGWVVDTYGERSALVWGNLAVGAFCLTVAGTNSFLSALLALAAVGIGAAFQTPAGSKAVMLWFPPAKRGMAMGMRQTGIPVGGALAAATLPAFSAIAGWRMAVVVSGVTCLLAAGVCWLVYQQPHGAVSPSGGSTQKGGDRLRDLLTRDIALLGLAGALLPLGQFAILTYLALYLKETQGIPVTTSAVLLVLAQIAGALGRILWGIWSDRLFAQHRRPAVLWANVSAAIMAVVLGWLPPDVPLWCIAVIVFVFAFNAIGWHGSWIALIAELAGPEKQGRTLGLAMSIMYPGIIIFPPLFGWLVDYTQVWELAWSVLAGVLVLGSALVWMVREEKAG